MNEFDAEKLRQQVKDLSRQVEGYRAANSNQARTIGSLQNQVRELDAKNNTLANTILRHDKEREAMEREIEQKGNVVDVAQSFLRSMRTALQYAGIFETAKNEFDAVASLVGTLIDRRKYLEAENARLRQQIGTGQPHMSAGWLRSKCSPYFERLRDVLNYSGPFANMTDELDHVVKVVTGLHEHAQVAAASEQDTREELARVRSERQRELRVLNYQIGNERRLSQVFYEHIGSFTGWPEPSEEHPMDWHLLIQHVEGLIETNRAPKLRASTVGELQAIVDESVPAGVKAKVVDCGPGGLTVQWSAPLPAKKVSLTLGDRVIGIMANGDVEFTTATLCVQGDDEDRPSQYVPTSQDIKTKAAGPFKICSVGTDRNGVQTVELKGGRQRLWFDPIHAYDCFLVTAEQLAALACEEQHFVANLEDLIDTGMSKDAALSDRLYALYANIEDDYLRMRDIERAGKVSDDTRGWLNSLGWWKVGDLIIDLNSPLALKSGPFGDLMTVLMRKYGWQRVREPAAVARVSKGLVNADGLGLQGCVYDSNGNRLADGKYELFPVEGDGK